MKCFDVHYKSKIQSQIAFQNPQKLYLYDTLSWLLLSIRLNPGFLGIKINTMDDSSEVLSQNQLPIQEVQAIPESRNQVIARRNQIPDLVEAPLIPGCLTLYDNNVQTLSSSANAQDAKLGKGYIFVDWDTLSDQNKKIAAQLVTQGEAELNDGYDGKKALKLVIPIPESTTVSAISEKVSALVSAFRKQKMRWAPTYTMQDMADIYRTDEVLTMDPEELAREAGYYYSQKDQKFYLSREHFDKVHEEVDEEMDI